MAIVGYLQRKGSSVVEIKMHGKTLKKRTAKLL